jgi:hypothetical protein
VRPTGEAVSLPHPAGRIERARAPVSQMYMPPLTPMTLLGDHLVTVTDEMDEDVEDLRLDRLHRTAPPDLQGPHVHLGLAEADDMDLRAAVQVRHRSGGYRPASADRPAAEWAAGRSGVRSRMRRAR